MVQLFGEGFQLGLASKQIVFSIVSLIERVEGVLLYLLGYIDMVCPLQDMILPGNLQDLALGTCFNQSLDHVKWPSTLQKLTFGHWAQILLGRPETRRETIEDFVQCQCAGYQFNRSLEHVKWPSNLRSLAFGHQFDQSLERGSASLQCFLS